MQKASSTAMVDVKVIRRRLGKSQADLAEAVGVDQATVSRWESRKAKPSGPARKILERMAAECGAKATPEAA